MPIPPKPTDAELAILRVLWNIGPASVRQVHAVMTKKRPIAYTTSLKMLQIMTDKGLVVREEVGRQHLYRAKAREHDTQRRLVADLLDRAFGGSLSSLVLQALASRPASAEELREIRRLIATHASRSGEKDDD
jgi:predicted transcriptional regulator